MRFNQKGEVNATVVLWATGIILSTIIGMVILFSTASWNETGETTIVQYMDGGRMVKLDPGFYFKWWGRTETWRKYCTVGFGTVEGEGSANIPAVDVIFNDGSLAEISGIVRVELPNNQEDMKELWKQYSGGYNHFVSKGIVPVVENAVRLSANLRDAQSAYTTIAILQADIQDQLKNGIFITESETILDTNMTGDIEKRKITTKKLGKDGQPLRERHILQEIGCKVTQCQIKVPEFDEKVTQAIAQRKQASLNTEIAKQQAIQAEQDAKTIAAKGKAQADSVKWAIEKEKAATVTRAEAQRDSSKLAMEAAEYSKKALILEGQGIAEKKRLVMQADGALTQKLETYRDVHALYAKAWGTYQGQMVPSTVIGGGGSDHSAANSLQSFMSLMTAKTARDLNLDMRVKK